MRCNETRAADTSRERSRRFWIVLTALVGFTPVAGSARAAAAQAAIDSTYLHTCAVLSNGTAKCWGRNPFGQLGTTIGSISGAGGSSVDFVAEGSTVIP